MFGFGYWVGSGFGTCRTEKSKLNVFMTHCLKYGNATLPIGYLDVK